MTTTDEIIGAGWMDIRTTISAGEHINPMSIDMSTNIALQLIAQTVCGTPVIVMNLTALCAKYLLFKVNSRRTYD